MARYLKNAARAVGTPPQSSPLDSKQVKNSAGGYVYPVTNWTRMERFLILGSEGGSYYAGEQALTKENLDAVAKCVAEDGLRAVKLIVDISDAGRAYKNDPAILALAYAAGKGNDETRAAALAALPKVARIGTHLFHFADFVKEFRGWGRGLRNAIGEWYSSQPIDRLADQVTKYQSRDGWSHRDLLRKSHPSGSKEQNAVYRWAIGQTPDARTVVRGKNEVKFNYAATDKLPKRIEGHIKLQAAKTGKEAAALIREYELVRESVPTELLKEKEVWEALLEKMPLTAMIRNLGKMSSIGLLVSMSDASKQVIAKLGDVQAMKKARVHPIQILVAQKTYESGHGLRGSLTWAAVPQVVDALDEAYYNAFDLVEPTGKRFYLGMDISGSMYSGDVAGIPNFSPAVASGAMAMVTVKTEKEYYVAGFTTKGSYYNGQDGVMEPISLSPKMRLDSVVERMRALSAKMGGTDCALPMLDALDKKMEIDVFEIFTDSESWAGKIHTAQALDMYRQKTGIPAKFVVVAMTANDYSVGDPDDGGTLNCVGFDASVPNLIADFVKA